MKKVISALAFFNCIFLNLEYLFDNNMMMVTDAEGVVLAQNYILGISVAGFLMFPLISDFLKKRMIYMPAVFGAMVTEVVCIFVIPQHLSYEILMISGGVLFFILGFLGSAAHYLTAKSLGRSPYLGRVVGTAYAIGIFLQFINNNLISNDTLEAVVLTVFLTMLVILLLRGDEQENGASDKERRHQTEISYVIRNRKIAAVMLILVVTLMACIFVTLDNTVTLVHAAGKADVGQWPRILLALSGFTADLLLT